MASPGSAPTLSIIIPVYNEKQTFQRLFDAVYALPIPGKELIIVDDFSHDGTRDLLALVDKPGVKIVLHDKNQGKGAAIRTGLMHASGEIIVPQDSDLELDPVQIIELLEFMKKNSVDAVYGSRFKGTAFRLNKYYLANWLLSMLTSILFFHRITDMETCYKMVKRNLLMQLNLRSSRFDIEPEITAKLLKRGVRILEKPVTYIPRSTDQGKKIKLKDAFSAVWALLKYRFID